jgi:hypothetical protein
MGRKALRRPHTTQKRLLLNGAMINNAYQTMTLSSTEGPKEVTVCVA